MALPSSPTDRKALNDKIEEAVNLKFEQKNIQADIDAIAEDVQEKFGIKKAEFNSRVKIRRLEKENLPKYQAEKEKADEIFEENELLQGKT